MNKTRHDVWRRARDGARQTLSEIAQARDRRARSGRPAKGKYPERVMRVIARYKRHDVPATTRPAMLHALHRLRTDVMSGASSAELLDEVDDLLFRLRRTS